MMFDYRLQLKEYDRRGIASFGEGCALFAALSSFVFVFCIGFDSSAYGSFDLYSAFSLKSAGAGFGIAAALIAILSVSALFALTVLRYIRFLTGKSQKDSVYFCYATVFCYLAGIMLFSECAAQGTYRLNGATVAGLILAGAGVLASVILFGIAGRKMYGREAKSRYPFFAVSLGILLMLFALLSLGMVTTEERLGLIFLFPEETLPENGTLAVFAFLFLIGFAANAVLLGERLIGGLAQQRKPVLVRAALTAAFAIASALCQMYLAPAPDDMTLLFFWGVPVFAMLLAVLLFICTLADAVITYEMQKRCA